MACLCPAADLAAVHTVYLLPMTGGLDQYLANRLAASGIFQVVADPKKADAIFTDKLGEAFEQRLGELLAPPPDREEKTAASTQDDRRVVISTFGRGKGTIFLVEAASRNVVWSAYEPPRSTKPNELDRTARRLVERLKSPPQSK
jgi:hypothetical protein